MSDRLASRIGAGGSPTPAGIGTAGDPAVVVGEWALDRRLVDRRLGRRGRVSGRLSVAADGDGYSWVEQGTLRWDGQEMAINRTLRLQRIAGAWWMAFADGRPFHPWQPGQPLVHPCRADTYTGLVDVDPSGEVLRVLWDVTGPDKDQRIFSRCHRIG